MQKDSSLAALAEVSSRSGNRVREWGCALEERLSRFEYYCPLSTSQQGPGAEARRITFMQTIRNMRIPSAMNPIS